MPQILFECSNNLIEQDLKPFLLKTHQILSEDLPTKVASCKSKINRYKECVIGDGNSKNAFINLAIGVLPGRSLEVKQNITTKIQDLLNQSFQQSKQNLNLQMSLSIYDLPKTYFKVEN